MYYNLLQAYRIAHMFGSESLGAFVGSGSGSSRSDLRGWGGFSAGQKELATYQDKLGVLHSTVP